MRETVMLRTGLLSAALVACSSSSSNSSDGGTTGGDSGTAMLDSGTGRTDSGGGTTDSGTTGDDGGTTEAGSNEGGASQAFVRVAHLSPGAPAVDFCVAPHGTTTFTGPVLAGAGAMTGIAYKDVTKYLPVPATQLDVRIVAPGGTSCATSLAMLPDFTSLPSLPAGAYVTIAAEGVVGSMATPFDLKPYIDDSMVDPAKGALRFVHASPGTPAVDVGLGSGSSFTAVFTNVAFGATAAAGAPIDANGFYVGAPFSMQTVSARVHGTTMDALTVPNVSLPAGAIATAFAIGVIGQASTPLAVLLCVDNGTPSGLLATCQ